MSNCEDQLSAQRVAEAIPESRRAETRETSQAGRFVLSGLRPSSIRVLVVAYLKELALEESFSQLHPRGWIVDAGLAVDLDSDPTDLEDLSVLLAISSWPVPGKNRR